MKKAAVILIFIFFILPLFAKTVKITLYDGTVIEGEIVAEYETKYIIKTIGGNMEVMKSNVKGKPVFTETPIEKYDRIVKGKTFKTAEEHIKIAEWCKKNNLQTQYFKHLHEALEIDPNNETANKAMGKVRYEKRWVENGQVKKEYIWVTQKEYEALHQKELDEVNRQKARKNGPGKTMGGSSKLYIPDVNLEDWQKDFAMPYINNLGSSNWRTRDAAINTLISQDFTDKLIPLVLKTVIEGNPAARESAIEALLRYKYPNLLPFLEDRMLKDKDKNVRRKAIYGLGEVGDAHSVSILLKALDTDDEEIIREIIASLENITFLPSGSMFGKLDPAKIKNKYRTWLSKNSGKTRREILDMVVEGGDPYQQINAARKLFAMGEFDVLQNLINLLKNEDENVQSDANRALVDLTGVDKGFKASITFKPTKEMYIDMWQEWFDGERERKKNQPREQTAGTPGAKPVVSSNKLIMDIADGGDMKDKAKETIMKMKKIDSIPLLIENLNHSDIFVRAAVYSMLINITKGEVLFGYDPKEENATIRMNFISKWEKWWKENKDQYAD